jgi:membrane protein DedA with SNARE-associated domain
MKANRSDIVQVALTALLVTTAITIASLTIGRDIYSGSAEGGLLAFAIVNFSGYLFFLFMPVELAFIYYLGKDINILLLNIVAISTAIVSQTIDYLTGFMFSTKIIDRLIGRSRYEKAENRLRRYGNIAIFLFNVTPLSSPVISLAAGMLNHKKKDAILLTLTGLITKYLILTLIFA